MISTKSKHALQIIVGALLLLFVVTGCNNEGQKKEETPGTTKDTANTKPVKDPPNATDTATQRPVKDPPQNP